MIGFPFGLYEYLAPRVITAPPVFPDLYLAGLAVTLAAIVMAWRWPELSRKHLATLMVLALALGALLTAVMLVAIQAFLKHGKRRAARLTAIAGAGVAALAMPLFILAAMLRWSASLT